MIGVRHAAFRRVLERGDQRYAEVEVHTDLPRSPGLLAYFRKEGGGQFQLIRVIANDADHELDGFDNHLHSASQDVASQLFAGPSHGGADDRHAFGRRVLAYDGLAEELARHLA